MQFIFRVAAELATGSRIDCWNLNWLLAIGNTVQFSFQCCYLHNKWLLAIWNTVPTFFLISNRTGNRLLEEMGRGRLGKGMGRPLWIFRYQLLNKHPAAELATVC